METITIRPCDLQEKMAGFAKNLELVKAMHTVIKAMNNEEAYCSWINTVPDEPSDDDFYFIAGNDDSMNEVCTDFWLIVRAYGSDGFYVGGDKAYGGKEE